MGESTDKLHHAVRFEAFYNAHYRDISGYVRRRVPEHEAADVIAQVFVVAWRRFEHVPSPPEDRLWLFGVARHSVADHRRSGLRRLRLHARLVQEVRPVPQSIDSLDSLHARVAAAIGRLRPRDREVLQLVLWDDLTHAEAAAILGCSVNAVELRFRRAQARVRDALDIISTTVDLPDVPLDPTHQWRSQP
jgi:RNA polymerase sigma factor (sigma-70 family)